MANGTKRDQVKKMVEEAIRNSIATEVPEKLVVKFRDQEFEIVSTYERDDALDDSADFIAAVWPFVTRIFQMIEASEDYNFGEGDEVSEFIAELDVLGLVDDFKTQLPKILRFIFKGSNPDITEAECKRIAGPIYNVEIYKAIFYQMHADGLTGRLFQIAAKIGQGVGNERAAATEA